MLKQQIKPLPNTRVSYILNGQQPVKCTYIGNEPFKRPSIHKDEGYAFCEWCQKVTGFHSEELEPCFMNEPFNIGAELVCNECDLEIVSFYNIAEKTEGPTYEDHPAA